MDISNWVAHRANWAPTRTAIHFEGAAWSNVDFENRVARLAGALRRELGVREGDRVAHLGLNSPDLLALFFACARIGALIVPLNWRLAAPEHAYQIADAEPSVILVEHEYWDHVGSIRAQFPSVKCVAYRGKDVPGAGWLDYEAMLAACAPIAPDAKRDLKTPCEIKYTSGTTGWPKGAVRTQEAVFYNAINSGAVFEITPEDHVLTAIPMFHAGGMHIQTSPAVHWGATLTVHRRFEPAAVLAEIRASRPTLLLSVPAASAAMIAHPDFAKTDVTCLKCICGGSSVVPEAVIRPWRERGVSFNQVYGTTETGPVAIASSIPDGKRKSASAGKPVPYMEAKLVNDAGETAKPGERGEIWLRGPTVLKEYWRNPAATAESITPDGWFKTGDVAHCDEEGFFYVDDRKKDMIISGGENIYPAELENILADYPEIAEFAVIGRPDPKWVEVPVCVVVRKPGRAPNAEDILALFQGKLARYKHPRDVVFMEGPLPRTSLGKVQKFELRKRLAIR